MITFVVIAFVVWLISKAFIREKPSAAPPARGSAADRDPRRGSSGEATSRRVVAVALSRLTARVAPRTRSIVVTPSSSASAA